MSAPKLRTDLGEPRLFCLVRTDDVSGVSGEGRVADGVEWPDGTVAVRWRTDHATTEIADSLSAYMVIHGHGGGTVVSWLMTAEGVPLSKWCESRSDVHGGHHWAKPSGTSVYEYWCEGRP